MSSTKFVRINPEGYRGAQRWRSCRPECGKDSFDQEGVPGEDLARHARHNDVRRHHDRQFEPWPQIHHLAAVTPAEDHANLATMKQWINFVHAAQSNAILGATSKWLHWSAPTVEPGGGHNAVHQSAT